MVLSRIPLVLLFMMVVIFFFHGENEHMTVKVKVI